MSVEALKLKRVIKTLQRLKGDSTSMLTLMVPPHKQLHEVQTMLISEASAASNIKSRVNRHSVEAAIAAASSRLKEYKCTPSSGLAVFCGTCSDDPDVAPSSFALVVEPETRPVPHFLYRCDNRFHTEVLEGLLDEGEKYGVVVIDGHGALYGLVQGQESTVLHEFEVHLPKKQAKGGQSAMRFERIRREKNQNFVTKASELANKMFLPHDCKGIILAGMANFKDAFRESKVLDYRLRKLIVASVDVAYSGSVGFQHALAQCREIIGDLGFAKQGALLETLFDTMARSLKPVALGVREVLFALEAGAVEKLYVWNELELKHPSGEDLLDWLVERHRSLIVLVSDKSGPGNQFAKGLGGLAAVLLFQVEFEEEPELEDHDDVDFL